MAKRKAVDSTVESSPLKKQAVKSKAHTAIKSLFREDLFDEEATRKQQAQYASSEPYRHGVISSLAEPILLRDVRSEIQNNLSFTPKETDIYKIHQSGDLANLDGLDDASLKLLPSLQKLRDALYSPEFRQYLCEVTGSSNVSGKKTDMAINIYSPGCHLLCHDDVIGSRRISYILYLTDPDKAWKEEWGGALRLYPTTLMHDEDGKGSIVPSPDHSKSISPAFNQLSFFAVQPGQSFHDVEEVYASDADKETSRTRMAISGWYHVPQEGEEGYATTDQNDMISKSSLAQLEGRGQDHDRPQTQVSPYGLHSVEGAASISDKMDLSEEDLDFLLQYVAPTYLTPDALEEVSNSFSEECSIVLDKFLSNKFCDRLRNFIESEDLSSNTTMAGWGVACPPHKHRYLYQGAPSSDPVSPMQELLKRLLPSPAFRKWFYLATGHTLRSHDVLARRFRRGRDYTLAQTYENNEPRIEICLSLTPSSDLAGGDTNRNGAARPNDEAASPAEHEVDDNEGMEDGGYLAYMAGDDEDTDDEGSHNGVEVPTDMSTGGRATRLKKPKDDPAVYQAQADDDDGVLFSMPAGWNKLGIVLRDKGTMRFVKYVSKSAKSDRWDIFGEFEIDDDDESDKEEIEDDAAPEDQSQTSDDDNEDGIINDSTETDDV